jgi:hypothetical protein
MLSGVTIFENFIEFKDRTLRLADLDAVFEGFPLAKNSYWIFEMTAVTSFNNFIRIEFAVVDIENEAAYLEEPCKPIGNSVMSVHAAHGNVILDTDDWIAAELENKNRMEELELIKRQRPLHPGDHSEYNL